MLSRPNILSKRSLFFGLILCLLFASVFNSPILAQDWKIESGAPQVNGGEYKVANGVCLVDSKRAEIQAEIDASIQKLRSEGKLEVPSPLFLPPPFIFPVIGNAGSINDFGVHGISNFVDQNPNFPNQLLDYNCGARTYDTNGGYNHAGVDIFTFPFSWNKMDQNEAAIVAAAPGVIVFKSDGNFDRSCGFNNNSWNAVYLQHSDGTISWYGHMKNGSSTTKPLGASVAQGEYLGIVGSSGNSTAPHLHLEIYDPANQLRDPYQGTCNTLNTQSYWQDQLPYRDSKINKIMTHSAPPNFASCPNPEFENEKNSFQPGEQLIVAGYYHDQVVGHATQWTLIQPDGIVATSFPHTSPNTYAASYWFFNLTIPAGVPSGVWTFRAEYQSETYEHRFTIGNFNNSLFDFDGDLRTDIGIWRPAPGEWWYLRSSDNSNRAFQFGSSADTIVPADFTGDGKTDIAFWRGNVGEWYVLRSEDNTFYAFPFGNSGDIPVIGDYDGDGKADSGVFRPAVSTWFIQNSSGGTTIQQFGANGDVPMPRDYDGDGKTDLAIFRPSVSEWYYQRSSDLQVFGFQFGVSGDKPIPADFTGDNRTDIAFWRPTTGEWYVIRSEDNSFYAFPFGTLGDVPIPGDYDGDGTADPAVFRPSINTWFLQQSTDGVEAVGFGIAGDVPVPSAYNH